MMDSTSPPAAPTTNREEADDYRRVVVVLNSDWRIIECRDGIQWILQRRSGERRGQPRWLSRKYNRNKEALKRNVHALAGEIDPAAREVLDSLPDWIEELL
jgi:hypothetical protein